MALTLLACSTERLPLEDDLEACRKAREEREAAAQFCEALYEAERDRAHHLSALEATSLPTGIIQNIQDIVSLIGEKILQFLPSFNARFANSLIGSQTFHGGVFLGLN